MAQGQGVDGADEWRIFEQGGKLGIDKPNAFAIFEHRQQKREVDNITKRGEFDECFLHYDTILFRFSACSNCIGLAHKRVCERAGHMARIPLSLEPLDIDCESFGQADWGERLAQEVGVVACDDLNRVVLELESRAMHIHGDRIGDSE